MNLMITAQTRSGSDRQSRRHPVGTPKAQTLSGTLTDYSTGELHSHPCHQILTIRNGISLLEDDTFKQPLYGKMCAFLPAGFLHRSIVIGDAVSYQSIYMDTSLFRCKEKRIILFTMSELSSALFNALASHTGNITEGFAGRSLRLFVEAIKTDFSSRPFLMQIPQPQSDESKKIIDYIESNFSRKLSLRDFRSALPYSSRHITRIFTQEMKISIFEYLRLYRIFMSSVMLHNRTKSVLAVAYACGYESLSSFYADFRKYYSLTPKEFRARTGDQ
ncbi:MAG TPA: AraC family transcriptional regulator [Spirochaetota bacterium]